VVGLYSSLDVQTLTNVWMGLILAQNTVLTHKAIIHVVVPSGTVGTEEKMVKVVL
jgi:RNase P/RNase MRP subunit POP5